LVKIRIYLIELKALRSMLSVVQYKLGHVVAVMQ